jgi:hypothetical protein
VSRFLGMPLFAQTATTVVFMGFPSRRSANMIGNNETSTLEEKDSKEYLCMITRKNGKLFWASRDNKEMAINVSGSFVVFSALDGSGYVKFAPDLKDIPIDYMEHLHDKLFTITYWGKSSSYRQ